MAQLNVTRAYQEGDILLESDIDTFLDEIEQFVNVTLLNDDNFQTGGIDAETKIIDSTITTSLIANDAVTSDKINDLAVTTAKLNASAVTNEKIADGAVTADKILDGSILTPYVYADGAFTYAKFASVNYAISSSCGNFSTSSTSLDVTNLSVTITTAGTGPVLILLVPDGSGNHAYFSTRDSVNSDYESKLMLKFNGSDLFYLDMKCTQTQSPNDEFIFPPGTLFFLHTSSNSTSPRTYKLTAQVTDGTMFVQYCKLLAIELR